MAVMLPDGEDLNEWVAVNSKNQEWHHVYHLSPYAHPQSESFVLFLVFFVIPDGFLLSLYAFSCFSHFQLNNFDLWPIDDTKPDPSCLYRSPRQSRETLCPLQNCLHTSPNIQSYPAGCNSLRLLVEMLLFCVLLQFGNEYDFRDCLICLSNQHRTDLSKTW